MDYELELTKLNRLKLARAFRNNKRVDTSIDCVIDGQMGHAFVDDPSKPTAYRITTGPFWYLAGDAHSDGACEMLKGFPAFTLLQPCLPDWMELAREIFGDKLIPFDRYSFSTEKLSLEHVSGIYNGSNYREQIIPISAELATRMGAMPEPYFEISDFDSIDDFLLRGIGFVAMDGDTVMGVAYSSLVYSAGIEVSIFVEEPYRQKGLATALGSRLVMECLQQGLRPNWDAANPESCKLAQKLGFTLIGSYEAYYHRPVE